MKKSIELLNKAIHDELTAVHQYLYFHFHCDDQGLDLLANLFKQTAIQEMQHVEKIADRILFLKGDVEMSGPQSVAKIKSVKEMLKMAGTMEQESAGDYNNWANECSANADAISRLLFESLAADEEKHYDQFNKESENIQKFGDNYLALQSIERSKKTSK